MATDNTLVCRCLLQSLELAAKASSLTQLADNTPTRKRKTEKSMINKKRFTPTGVIRIYGQPCHCMQHITSRIRIEFVVYFRELCFVKNYYFHMNNRDKWRRCVYIVVVKRFAFNAN
jgi:hypothetical protein